MQIHPRVALGAKLLLASLPLWLVSYLIYLSIMGIYGSTNNIGLWLLGGGALLIEFLTLGLLSFLIVTSLWHSPKVALQELKDEWWSPTNEKHSINVHEMDLGMDSSSPYVDEDSPRVNLGI